mmetsp:Transcript_128802/g.358605  ORF Transcript_128802/g.358605 Transcript_128802/m.358605 type:complete len:663 (+) Transcript_128802:72-2060(+)
MSYCAAETDTSVRNAALARAADYLDRIALVMRGEEPSEVWTPSSLGRGGSARSFASGGGLLPPHGAGISDEGPAGCASNSSGVGGRAVAVPRLQPPPGTCVPLQPTPSAASSSAQEEPPAAGGVPPPQPHRPAAQSGGGSECLTLDSNSPLEEPVLDLDMSPWGANDNCAGTKKLLPTSTHASNSDVVCGSECFAALVEYLVGVLKNQRFPESKLREFRTQLVTVVHKLCQVHAMLQLHDDDTNIAEKLQDIVQRTVSADELSQTSLLLSTREVDPLSHWVQPCTGETWQGSIADDQGYLRAHLQRCERDLASARQQLDDRTRALRRLELQVEKDTQDYANFIKHVTGSPFGPMLPKTLDLGSAEILSMGSYGYLFLCQDRESTERVSLKVQSQRWLDVAVKEWAHGTDVGPHPHVAAYKQIVINRDVDREILRCLESSFAAGTLQGRRPSLYPESYVCVVLEYMDHGTLQDLMDTHRMTPECVAAVLHQVAKALAFMHSRQRAHNDIRPENILLRQSPVSNGLAVKLADCGLAAHSVERRCDCDLLGYTAWCAALDRPFQRCPGRGEQAGALADLAAAAPVLHGLQLWGQLTEAIRGLWQGELTMADVEGMEALCGHEVRVPQSVAHHLEEQAKESLKKRSSLRWQRCREGWLQKRWQIPE